MSSRNLTTGHHLNLFFASCNCQVWVIAAFCLDCLDRISVAFVCQILARPRITKPLQTDSA